MSVSGGSWQISDTPLHLHTFEYMVRAALLKWWKWCLPGVPYLNTATQIDLQRIPGIGPKQAESIVAHRISHGKYGRFDDLLSVAGIGQKAATAIKAHTVLVEK